MDGAFTRTRLGDGIFLNAIPDKKFKYNRISVNFVLPLEKSAASDNAVTPHILRMGCRALPDFSSLNARLQELYGASLDANVSKFGGYQVLEVSIRGLDNRYALEGEDVTAACAELLSRIVLEPKLDGEGFLDATNTSLQRRFIQDTIEAEINDKRVYALIKCIQAMCEDEPVSVRPYGYPETAAAITPQSATAAYRRMLKYAPVEIMFTGSGDPEPASRVFAEAFGGIAREPGGYPPVKLRPVAERVRELTESMDVNQAKLVLGMRCGSLDNPRELYAARVFSSLFGGTPFSRLFLNVRERLGLCYYCAARFDSSTRLLMVDSGIDPANKKKAQDEILAQLAAIAGGDVGAEELADTKRLLKSSIRATADSASAIEGWYMSQILRGQSVSPEEDVRNIEAVTAQEVVAAARQVTLDTVYFLNGTQGKEAG